MATQLSAGQLNRRVVIQSPPTAQDADGQPTGDWTTVATVWANVRQPSGMARINADQAGSTVRTSIRLRWLAGLETGMRAVDGANTYDVQAVLYDHESRAWVDLVCELRSGGA